MSTVVFNKHVEFCEAYMKALQELLGKLFTEGPTQNAWVHLHPLYEVRRNYRLWISSSMAGRLDEFERKVGEMAGALGIRDSQRKSRQYTSGTNEQLDKAYTLFLEITDTDKAQRNDADAESKKAQGYSLVIEHLQGILGIETLTDLRDKVLRNAGERE